MSQILTEYDDKAKIYGEFISKARQIIEEIINQNGLSLYEIKVRVKTRESIENKLNKPLAKYSNLAEITDIAGIRITTYFEDDVKKIANLLENEFCIDKLNSMNKNDLLAPDRFGYLSMHHVATFNDLRIQLTEYRRFKDLKLEIQTRSILQHAWAEIEHDLGYKSAYEIPANIRRRFSRLAGLLELADQEFITIRNELDIYSKGVTEQIKNAPQEVTIDLNSLDAYVKHSEVVDYIDNEISKIDKSIIVDHPSRGVSIKLNYLKILTIDKLDSILKAKKELIIKFARHWVELTNKETEVEMGGSFSKGIAIFYLGYVLVAETKDKDFIKEYLIQNISSFEGYDYDEFVEEVMITYQKVLEIN